MRTRYEYCSSRYINKIGLTTQNMSQTITIITQEIMDMTTKQTTVVVTELATEATTGLTM